MNRLLRACSALILSCFGTLACVAQQTQQKPEVVLIHLDDTIQPISAGYMARGLDFAAAQHASAVLIEINTPGGLLDSTRQMVSRILASPVPIIVYVAPSGSRAGSAGFFLLEAADIAAMAPGSNAGAAHPVVEGGAKLDDIMKQKLENDTAAFLRSYVARRGRNVAAAEDAIRASKSYSDQEALQLKLIDLVAPNDADLLNTIDGRTITRFDGSTMVLHTRDARLVAVEPTLREKILDRLTDPNLAVLVLVIGGLLIYVEFNTPGTIIPGTLGTILVLLAIFSLNLLPVRYTSVMLLAVRFCIVDPGSSFRHPWDSGCSRHRRPGDWGSYAGRCADTRAASASCHCPGHWPRLRSNHRLSLASSPQGAAKQVTHGSGRHDWTDRGGHPAARAQRPGDSEW